VRGDPNAVRCFGGCISSFGLSFLFR